MTSGRSRKRAAERAGVDQIREIWSDTDYGVRLERVRRGRGQATRLVWDLDAEPVITLMALPVVRSLLDSIEREYVLGERAIGTSWDDIGYLLGGSGEAARRRHARVADELEGREAHHDDGPIGPDPPRGVDPSGVRSMPEKRAGRAAGRR